MKILYIVTVAEFGGPSRHVLWLMEYLMKQGHIGGLVSAPEPRLMQKAQKLGAWFTNTRNAFDESCSSDG
ncbi:hypothetical protein KJ830_08335 [bacterium]|nr:hypothetical protein [bacterium]MBU4511038.1 hypothetical protein [bacterium]